MPAEVSRSVRQQLRAKPGVALDGYDTRDTGGVSKSEGVEELPKLGEQLAGGQERLYAEHSRSLLVVLQGMDTSGKGGVGEHVLGFMNPAGVHVTSFKAPTNEEQAHHFLWRIRRNVPSPGRVGVFDRSHYEDVGIGTVHHLIDERTVLRRYDEINQFEAELAAGTTVVKCFLHISFEEQTKRLLARLEDPTKRWKFNPRDLDERELWPDYMAAYSRAIDRCSTDAAPWYVVPADRKWYRNWAIASLLAETFEEMDPHYPQPDLDVEAMKARLLARSPAPEPQSPAPGT